MKNGKIRQWVSTQRSLYKKGVLDLWKVDILKNAKFNFNPYYNFLSYNDARDYVRSLGLKSWTAYVKSGNKPSYIPEYPGSVYKNKGWINTRDWMGIEKKDYLSFEDAKKIVASFELRSQTAWEKLCKSGKKPNNIPYHPERIYKDKWKSWGDWLGTGFVSLSRRVYLDYEDAKKVIATLNIKSQHQWDAFAKSGLRPENIPSSPHNVYKNKGWKSWGDWLGTGYVAQQYRVYLDYNEAIKFVHKLKLKSGAEWVKYIKTHTLPPNIPRYPDGVYKNKGWEGWGKWIGKIK